ncbi:hypothetical protein J7M23_09090, partial [Candidatus Sumerlaeota bacterium]|nr:hypothetical protein [Candidatus Sumerlaeota bacterium]
NYGELILARGELDQSLFYFTYAMDIARESYAPILQIIKRFEKSHELSPEARVRLARFYIDVSDLKRARQEIEKVNMDSPQRDFFLLRGELHFLEGNREKARRDFATELEFFPDNLPALIYEDSLTSPLYKLETKIVNNNFIPLLDTTHPAETSYVRILNDMIALKRADSKIVFTLRFDHPMNKRCYIIAHGTPALGIFPILKITENGNNTHLVYINRETWWAYPIDLQFKPGINTLEIQFINDGWVYKEADSEGSDKLAEDRNVFLNNLWYYKETNTTETVTGLNNLSQLPRHTLEECEQEKR